MPEIISCPECERKLRVPDHLLGKKVKCPGCGTMFTGQAQDAAPEKTPKTQPRAAAPREERIEEKPRAGRRPVVPPPPLEEFEEEPDEEVRPRKRRPRLKEEDEDYPVSARGDAYEDDEDEPAELSRRAREGWRKVSSGLGLVSLSGWIDIALNVCGLIFYVILLISIFALIGAGNSQSVAPGPAFRPGVSPTGSPPSSGLAALGIFTCLFSALFLIGGLATLVLKSIGYGFCMSVPTTRGNLKTLAVTTFSLFLSGMIMVVPSCLLSLLVIVAGLLIFASLIVFVVFLRGVALLARDTALAGRLLILLIAWGVYIGLYFLSMGLLYAYGYSVLANSLPALGGGGPQPNPAAALSGVASMIYVSLGLMALMMLAGMGLYIWYILLVRQTRGVVERRLLRRV